MRNLILLSAATVWLFGVPTFTVAQASTPDFLELKLVARLPPELPQRISGLAFDGEKLWATIYLGRGQYVKLDPSTLTWASDNEIDHYRIVANVAGAFGSPGGVCFANGTLWVAGFYGQSLGAIDIESWKVRRLFTGKQRPDDEASQSYSSIAFDGNYLWIAWHWFRYDLPVSQTQRLLKVDPNGGKVVAQYAAPAGTRNDGAHGLTWDGTRLWHMKDNRLASIDPLTGEVTAEYIIRDIKRPSGLAWANDSLWIAEFDGTIWRLPFRS
jgi:hypothetical protein